MKLANIFLLKVNNIDTWIEYRMTCDVILVSLLLTLNMFHNLLTCFYRGFWACICLLCVTLLIFHSFFDLLKLVSSIFRQDFREVGYFDSVLNFKNTSSTDVKNIICYLIIIKSCQNDDIPCIMTSQRCISRWLKACQCYTSS